MTVSRPTARPIARRADAEHNREKILTTARAAFAEPGAEVSMAEISRRAEVGMATLYRNFPGRRELLEALYTDEIDALCAAARDIRADSPREAFVAWLRVVLAFVPNKRAIVSQLLEHTDHDDPILHENRARALDAGRPLLTAAQQAHEIRGQLPCEQIIDMINAIAKIP